jgi:hypothetical protein
VPVGATARDEPEELAERTEARDILGGVPGVAHLDAVETQGHERLDPLPGTGATRMGEHGDASRGVHEINRFGQRERQLRDERRPLVSQVAVEGIP